MSTKQPFRSAAKAAIIVFTLLGLLGTVGFVWRNATVSKLFGLELEQVTVSTTNKLGLVRRTVAFEPDSTRFDRTSKTYGFLANHFPWLVICVYQPFPSLHWRIGLGAKPLLLGADQMEWSTGGSSGGYLYATEPSVANSKWEFVRWNGMNINELTPDIIRKSFGEGPKESETFTIAAGQILFTRLSTKPETIYVLKIQASYLNRVIVDYASVPSLKTWPLATATDRDAVNCLANLRRLGTYAALYAEAHGGIMPSNFAQLRSASPEPLRLECNGKLSEGTAIYLDGFEHESSYIIIAPSVDSKAPESLGRVFAGCLKHGYVCLTDGSANICREPRDKFMDEYLSQISRTAVTNFVK